MFAPLFLAMQLDVTRCAPIEGDRAVTVSLTSLQKSGSGGAGSLARMFFDLGSPNSPIVGLELRANGNSISSIDGPNLMNTAGMKFAVPAPGTYDISVFARNEFGCSREMMWRNKLVVPGVIPPTAKDYCPTLNNELASGWLINVPWPIENKVSVMIFGTLPNDYPLKNHLIQLDDPRAFIGFDIIPDAFAFDNLLQMNHAPFTYEPIPIGLIDAGTVLVHDTVIGNWWRNELTLITGPSCNGSDSIVDECTYTYTEWQNLGLNCPFNLN